MVGTKLIAVFCRGFKFQYYQYLTQVALPQSDQKLCETRQPWQACEEVKDSGVVKATLLLLPAWLVVPREKVHFCHVGKCTSLDAACDMRMILGVAQKTESRKQRSRAFTSTKSIAAGYDQVSIAHMQGTCLVIRICVRERLVLRGRCCVPVGEDCCRALHRS